MNLLFTIMRYWPAVGGAETQFHELAMAFSHDHSVTVATQTTAQYIVDPLRETTIQSPEPCMYHDDNVNVHIIHPDQNRRWLLWPMLKLAHTESTKWLGLHFYAAALEQALLKLAANQDIVYNALVGTEYFSALSFRVARRMKIPFVIRPMVHPGSWGDSPFLIKLYRQADAVLALLDCEKQYYIGLGIPEDRIHVVGIFPILSEEGSSARFRAQHHIQGRIVLFLGRKVSYKGYQALLSAAPLVWNCHADVTFVCIGPEETTAQPEDINDDPRIRLIGSVSEQEKADAMAACDIFCLPSRHEIFPSTILEAWHFKKPVIVGDIPYLRELVGNGECGDVVEQNPEQIAQHINALFDNPSQMEQLGWHGQQKLKKHYSKDVVISTISRIFEELKLAHIHKGHQ